MSEGIPICAECKHIRGEWGRWERWLNWVTRGLLPIDWEEPKCAASAELRTNFVTGEHAIRYADCRAKNLLGQCRLFETKERGKRT